jgi:hypothetical protein
LEDDILAIAVLMHEGGADRDPEIILAFPLVHRVGGVARLLIGRHA